MREYKALDISNENELIEWVLKSEENSLPSGVIRKSTLPHLYTKTVLYFVLVFLQILRHGKPF